MKVHIKVPARCAVQGSSAAFTPEALPKLSRSVDAFAGDLGAVASSTGANAAVRASPDVWLGANTIETKVDVKGDLSPDVIERVLSGVQERPRAPPTSVAVANKAHMCRTDGDAPVTAGANVVPETAENFPSFGLANWAQGDSESTPAQTELDPRDNRLHEVGRAPDLPATPSVNEIESPRESFRLTSPPTATDDVIVNCEPTYLYVLSNGTNVELLWSEVTRAPAIGDRLSDHCDVSSLERGAYVLQNIRHD